MGGRRKIIKRAIVFLLLGAIVNVAVAWGMIALLHDQWHRGAVESQAGYWPSPHPRLVVWSESSVGVYNVAAYRITWSDDPQEIGATSSDFAMGSKVVPQWSFLRRLSLEELQRDISYCDFAWGWPALALHACIEFNYVRSEADQDLVMEVMRAHGGVTPNWFVDWDNQRYAIPFTPIWPGFAINTIFYAAILWLLWGVFAAPFALRRRRRIKRGLCPACAYPVGERTVCTECGAAVITSRDRQGAVS